MFSDADKQIESILKLVEKCPEPLKEKCFAILLQAYVDSKKQPAAHLQPPASPTPRHSAAGSSLPPAIAPRFKTLAKRLGIAEQKLESLFDFGSEPFVLAPYQVPGDSIGARARNVALLVAAKSYLATGVWAAEWNEVKLECINQTCYDGGNHGKNLNSGGLFKSIVAGKPVELNAAGHKTAEELLKTLVEQQ
jgi:hypothetical protein